MTVDLHTLREHLAATPSDNWWRGLDELAQTPDFQEYVAREFPEQASEWTNPVTRRRFLVLLGASLGLAGLSGCGRVQPPVERIMPYVRQPEQVVLGKPLFYATAMTLGGYASGLLVESHEGRPTKVEGNPDHPASPSDWKFGPTDLFAQASVLGLYDPDRSQAVTHLGRPRSWAAALTAIQNEIKAKGAGLRLHVLTGTASSPTLASQMRQLVKKFPRARWHSWEPINEDNARAGASMAFGEDVHTYLDHRQADVILSLDANFLSCGPSHLLATRQFADRRRPDHARGMNRLYVVEPMPTNTGASADHHLALRASQIEGFARAVAGRLGIQGAAAPAEMDEKQQKWADAVAADLKKHRGAGLVLVGDGQPPHVHALAHAMNHALGNIGTTVLYTEPVTVSPPEEGEERGQLASLRLLVRAMELREVDVLLVVGVNPVYAAPADLNFQQAMGNVPLRIHLGLYQDETALQCHWHLPESHYLEAWGDARAFDGTASIVQPLIAPLYDCRSALEVATMFTDAVERPGHDIVRDHWRDWHARGKKSGSFESLWQGALHKGVVAGTAAERKTVTLRDVETPNRGVNTPRSPEELEIIFRPAPTLYDGRFANNGWLQELPKPVTRLTWDNAAFISPKTAEKLGVSAPRPATTGGEHGQAIVDMVELKYGPGEPIQAPVWVLPGHADDCVTVHLGHGRTQAGKVGTNSGFSAYRLQTAAAPHFGTGLQVRKLGETHSLACVQMHHSMEERQPVRAGTLDDYRKAPAFAHKKHEEPKSEANRRLVPLTMYTEHKYDGYKWGMSVDLSACVGCGACVVACQAENNIPVVGKEEVERAREMHWLRVDRYYRGDLDQPESYFQPVPCMQCENAPCELVCPVGATVHSQDGLNDMVYNRCVGTRYCSNNCPYKVRRFNFFQYADYATKSLRLLNNPEVTVRTRGVMEKCTYCVQRIRAAEITAEKEGRRVRDGDVLTACQSACPARAIVFGDLNDPKVRVTQLQAGPRNYALLDELNTRPRTTYLAAVRNPNPELT